MQKPPVSNNTILTAQTKPLPSYLHHLMNVKMQYGAMGHSLYSTPLFVRLALIMHATGLQRRECRTGEQDAKQTLFFHSLSLSLMRTCARIHKRREKYDHNLQRLHIDTIS